MIKFAKYEFYEQNEQVLIPRSFDLIAGLDQKMDYDKSAFASICDRIKTVYWSPMMSSKVGHNEERRSCDEIRKYYNYD